MLDDRHRCKVGSGGTDTGDGDLIVHAGKGGADRRLPGAESFGGMSVGLGLGVDPGGGVDEVARWIANPQLPVEPRASRRSERGSSSSTVGVRTSINTCGGVPGMFTEISLFDIRT